MRIGIDFGTTYTKIAYLQDGELRLFAYPGASGYTYIPTAVAYRRENGRQVITIGEAAQSEALNYEGVHYADRFKMLLPLRDEEAWATAGWNLPLPPDAVARDFFDQLLRQSEFSLERVFRVEPESIVVSVPELWHRTANNIGAETLRRLLAEELHLPVDHLRSEPVCAAAYFVYEYRRSQQNPGEVFNLLVCDMGGGTFDVALCRVQGQKIDVLDFDGMGQEGLGSAGALFDQNAVRTALAQQGETASPEEVTDLLRAFEERKIQSHDHVVALSKLWDDPRTADTEVYRFRRKYFLTVSQVKQCFEPVERAICEVLQRLRRRCAERQQSIDRIAIVGGFGQFPLVQHTILRELGVHDQNDERFDTTLHSQHRQFYAIAYGAALIANGIIEPVEYYPHTIAVRVRLLSRGEWKEGYLPVLESGRVPAGSGVTCWAQQRGKQVEVRVERCAVDVLPVYIQLHGSDRWLRIDLPPTEYPEPGTYHVGIRIDRSNMGTLIFESPDGKRRREYRLGDVNPVLSVEEK